MANSVPHPFIQTEADGAFAPIDCLASYDAASRLALPPAAVVSTQTARS
ncbi:hypothetical protein NTH_00421 [Nitratireductor thuwali]|uniref:Uncharacterized protein n=1 Tax=Nitratireductor thuwali TaxID=2267699 RepID=A0ABY5MFR6_9HYPH|nr:hypothetical protein NTH_00421 [Nitratireductor thuwali]